MDERSATAGGFAAILLWSSTTLLMSLTSDVPPILFLSMANICSFTILASRWVVKRKNPLPYFTGNPKVLLWTMFGLGFQTLCLVYAVRMIPVVEANLINYLWPMLTVIAVSCLPGHVFKTEYILGALIGFAGVLLVVKRPDGLGFDFAPGHFVALVGAATWAVYSAGTRLLKRHPGDFNTAAFLCNSTLLFCAHQVLEPPWAFNLNDFLLIALLGSLSGAAYVLWDKAMKHGHAQIVSVASNSMPLLSTLYLIAGRQAPFTPSVIGSALLILSGTLIASQEKIRAAFTKRAGRLKKETGLNVDTDTP
ncbi:MAG: DMT family transporter [Rhodospirillales bacterium]|nr:DMT family transporter [Alphaproteobacteria bacterium]MCB1839829.1 DMT family transporter [Alphaproteobacteria bacterium]MCB9976249.1 DMT family transporter [Rhodospirillales bacterium]